MALRSLLVLAVLVLLSWLALAHPFSGFVHFDGKGRWREVVRAERLEWAEARKRKQASTAARKAFESLLDSKSNLSDKEVAKKIETIRKYEHEYDRIGPAQFRFFGLSMSELLEYLESPSLTRCSHIPELEEIVQASENKSPGWRRFVKRILDKQMDLCDEEARKAMADFQLVFPERWSLIKEFVEKTRGLGAPEAERGTQDGVSGGARPDAKEADRLARKLKEACNLFSRKGLRWARDSKLRDASAIEFRAICREVTTHYSLEELADLIQAHAITGTRAQ